MLPGQCRPAGPALPANRGRPVAGQRPIRARASVPPTRVYPHSLSCATTGGAGCDVSATRLSCCAPLLPLPSRSHPFPSFFPPHFPFFVYHRPCPTWKVTGTPRLALSLSLLPSRVASLYGEQMPGPHRDTHPPLQNYHPSLLETWPNDPSPLRCRRCTCTTDSTPTCLPSLTG